MFEYGEISEIKERRWPTGTVRGGGAIYPGGLGLGFAMMPVAAASYRGLSFEEVPRASTATNIIRQVGGSLGVAVFAVVLQNSIAHQFPVRTPRLGAVPSDLPLTLANRLADAFSTSFWWSFGVCAFAILPAIFLPGPVGEVGADLNGGRTLRQQVAHPTAPESRVNAE